jgi:hypothetical protein
VIYDALRVLSEATNLYLSAFVISQLLYYCLSIHYLPGRNMSDAGNIYSKRKPSMAYGDMPCSIHYRSLH